MNKRMKGDAKCPNSHHRLAIEGLRQSRYSNLVFTTFYIHLEQTGDFRIIGVHCHTCDFALDGGEELCDVNGVMGCCHFMIHEMCWCSVGGKVEWKDIRGDSGAGPVIEKACTERAQGSL